MPTCLEVPLVSNGLSPLRAEAEGLRGGWCVHGGCCINKMNLFTVDSFISCMFAKTLKAKSLKVVVA